MADQYPIPPIPPDNVIMGVISPQNAVTLEGQNYTPSSALQSNVAKEFGKKVSLDQASGFSPLGIKDIRKVEFFKTLTQAPEDITQFSYKPQLTKGTKPFHIRPENWDKGMNPQRKDIPSIYVTEYQPGKFMMLVMTVYRILERIGKIGQNVIQQADQYKNFWKQEVTHTEPVPEDAAPKGKLDLVNIKQTLLTGAGIDQILKNPLNEIKNYFQSAKVAEYIIPFDQDTFIQTDGKAGWAINSLTTEKKEDGGISGAVKDFFIAVQSEVGQWTDTEPVPYGQWNLEDPMSSKPEEITVRLVLYNYNTQSTNDNLMFLYRLCSGPQWLQVGVYKNSGNLYEIRVPGRFNYFYSSMGVTVNEKGNRRIFTAFDTTIFPKKGLTLPNEKFFIPDIFEVTLSFEPLVPNNFNVYLNSIFDKYKDMGEVPSTSQKGK